MAPARRRGESQRRCAPNAVGTARSIPSTPAIAPPASTAKIVTTGWRSTARPTTTGITTWSSNSRKMV